MDTLQFPIENFTEKKFDIVFSGTIKGLLKSKGFTKSNFLESVKKSLPNTENTYGSNDGYFIQSEDNQNLKIGFAYDEKSLYIGIVQGGGSKDEKLPDNAIDILEKFNIHWLNSKSIHQDVKEGKNIKELDSSINKSYAYRYIDGSTIKESQIEDLLKYLHSISKSEYPFF